MRVLVTGATGFIGTALCRELRRRGFRVRAAVRSAGCTAEADESVAVGDISDQTDWTAALRDVAVVFHLAGLAHRTGPRQEHGQNLFMVNTRAAARLASASSAVDRFVFLSTIKIHGESSGPTPLREGDPAAPVDPYAQSKWLAELAVRERLPSHKVTILRTPLVYGPSVRANFLALMHVVDRQIPLPFGAVDNRRSLIYVGNLVDALILSAVSPQAAAETFLVSDGEDLSTPDLVRRIAEALHRKPRLIAVPLPLLGAAATLTLRRASLQKIVGNLQADITRIRSTIVWRPPFTVTDALLETSSWFRRLR